MGVGMGRRETLGSDFAEDEYQFAEVTWERLAGDGAGNLYILDRQGARVLKYGPDGRHLATFGRQGEGPGELSQAAGPVFVGPGDTLSVPDAMQQRVNRYTATGEPVGSYPLPMTEGIAVKWMEAPDQAVPLAGDAARIVRTDGTARTVTYDVSAPSLGLLSIDLTGPGGEELYAGYIARTRMQLQFNRELSLRLVTQYVDFGDAGISIGGWYDPFSTNGFGPDRSSAPRITPELSDFTAHRVSGRATTWT